MAFDPKNSKLTNSLKETQNAIEALKAAIEARLQQNQPKSNVITIIKTEILELEYSTEQIKILEQNTNDYHNM
jgi:hypothetical protein